MFGFVPEGYKKGLTQRVKPFLLKNVGVRRLELPTSTSRTWRAANCATPRLAFSVQIYKLFFIYPYFYDFF